jgi:hypothetical protein
MPCADVTELITVTVGPDDTLQAYRFHKRTCGQGVGADSLLLEQFAGLSVDALLALDAETFIAEHPVELEIEEFLNLKHLFAVQAALEVLCGKEPGGKDDPCAAATVAVEPDGSVVIEGRIAVDLMTEKIRSCGNCKGCGTKKKVVFH